MKRSMFRTGLTGLVAASALLALGCATNTPAESESYGTRYPGGERAPAQPAAPAKTEAKPAPVADAGWIRESMAFPTGNVATSVLLVERMFPSEIYAGQAFDYELKVTNLTDLSLREVVLSDYCASNFKMLSSSPDATTSNPPHYTWRLGDMDPKASKTVKIKGQATGAGTITSCATVTYNSLLCATANVVDPALKLALSAPPEVTQCDPIPIKVTVTNSGTGTVRNAKVTGSLPAGLKTAQGQNTFAFDAGAIGAGQSRDFTINAMAEKTGSFATKATASASPSLSAEAPAVTTVVKKPVLTLAMEGLPKRYFGAPVCFNLSVKNTGDTAANATMVEVPIPAGAQFASATEGGRASATSVVWNFGSLAPNASKSFSVCFNPSGIGSVAASATAKATCADAVAARSATDVEGIPAVLLEVIDVNDPVLVGETTTYLISVTNQGTKTDTNVKIVCSIPAEAAYVSSSGATTGSLNGGTLTFAPLPSLAPKAKAEWRIVVKAGKEGDVRFGVEMDTDFLTKNVTETEATRFYEFR